MNAAAMNLAKAREVPLGAADVELERRADGAILLRSPHPLSPHPARLTERLVHWAREAPARRFIAQRDAGGYFNVPRGYEALLPFLREDETLRKSFANTLLKDRVLFGSDNPVIQPDRWLEEFAKLPIKPEVRPLILKENAAKLLGLK